MTVTSPKTEHIAGKGYRVVPIFTDLRPYLEESFGLAEAGAEFVVPGPHRAKAMGPAGWKGCNLATQVQRLVRRAGLKPWPKTFNNLRASCAADLHKRFPAYLAATWMGHSVAVAGKHYLGATDADVRAAAGIGVPGKPVVSRPEPAQEGGSSTAGRTARLTADRVGLGETRRDTPPAKDLESTQKPSVCPPESTLALARSNQSTVPDRSRTDAGIRYEKQVIGGATGQGGAQSGAPSAGVPPDVLDLARRLAALTPEARAAVAALIGQTAVPPSR